MTPSLQGEPGTSPPVQGELPLRTGLRKRDQAAAKHEAELARLVPIIRKLAQRGPVTLEDLRRDQGGLESKGRELSWLGALPGRAGLVRVGYVRSTLPGSGGNLLGKWVLP